MERLSSGELGTTSVLEFVTLAGFIRARLGPGGIASAVGQVVARSRGVYNARADRLPSRPQAHSSPSALKASATAPTQAFSRHKPFDRASSRKRAALAGPILSSPHVAHSHKLTSRASRHAETPPVLSHHPVLFRRRSR